MKKWFILLLCVTLVFSMTACGDSKEPAEPAEPAESSENEAGELTATKFWKAAIPADLVLDEDFDEEDAYSYHSFGVKDGDDFTEAISVQINVQESARSIREKIADAGFDLHAYADQTLEEGVTVGGVYCVKFVDTWGDTFVIGRDEARQTSLKIIIQEDGVSEEDVARLLDSFTLLTEDVGHKDGPYPWDGERIAVSPETITDGGYTMKAEPIEFDEPITTYEVFEVDGAVAGDYLYVLYPGHILAYDAANPSEVVGEIEVPTGYDSLQGCADGRLFVCGFAKDTLVYQGFEQVATLRTSGILGIVTSGAFGYQCDLSNEKAEKLTITADNTVTEEPIAFVGAEGTAMQGVSRVIVADQTVALAGSHKESGDQMMGVYDYTGKLIKELYGTDDKAVGSIQGYIEDANGYIGCDSNMRNFKIWDKEGALVAVIDAYALTGTHYPWISNVQKMADGNVYMILTQNREDDSSLEVLVYRVTVNP